MMLFAILLTVTLLAMLVMEVRVWRSVSKLVYRTGRTLWRRRRNNKDARFP